jgi:hypothetical protein
MDFLRIVVAESHVDYDITHHNKLSFQECISNKIKGP